MAVRWLVWRKILLSFKDGYCESLAQVSLLFTCIYWVHKNSTFLSSTWICVISSFMVPNVLLSLSNLVLLLKKKNLKYAWWIILNEFPTFTPLFNISSFCCLGRLLVSFSGKYLKYDYCVASPHNWTGDGISCAFDSQLYKIYVPYTEPNLFGPAFIEVVINWWILFFEVLSVCCPVCFISISKQEEAKIPPSFHGGWRGCVYMHCCLFFPKKEKLQKNKKHY